MDTSTPIEPMQPGRFLELLNKNPRTEEEERDLQQELLRQAAEKAKVEGTAASETPADATPVEGQATEANAEETSAQPDAPVAPTEPETPATGAEENAAYSLTQLSEETNDAVEYLKTVDQTPVIEMATAAFIQAAYWLKLVGEGK